MKKYILVTILFSSSLSCMQENKRPENHYNQHSKPQLDLVMEYIQVLDIKPDEHMLDVGCGSGKITKVLANLVPKGFVIGIDNSALQIETARKENCADNISFQTIDAESINFNEQFDRVFSSRTLHWIEDHEAVFRGCARTLKKGGLLHILTGGDDMYDSPGVIAFNTILGLDKWKSKVKGAMIQYYLFALTEKNARDLLEKAKLEAMEIKLHNDDAILPNIEAFRSFISKIAKGCYPFLRELPEIEKEDFIEDILKLYVELVPPDENGSIRYPMSTLIIFARKS